ncbi:MAG: Tol-Pal system beta propeller repeat protein TolB [Nitrospirota bacterium]
MERNIHNSNESYRSITLPLFPFDKGGEVEVSFKKIVLLFIVSLIFYLNGGILSFAGDVFLETKRTGFQKVPIGIFDFVNSTHINDLDKNTLSILKHDLIKSDVFEIIEIESFGIKSQIKTPPDTPLINKAGSSGINLLVWGDLFWRDKELIMESRVFETAPARFVFGKRYVGSQNLFRKMVHRLSDELVYRYTGERGIAQTKIAYVSDINNNKELYLMDYDGNNSFPITGDKSINISPNWSPDGKLITYTSYRDGNPNIYILDTTTSRRQMIVSFPHLNISPVWSPSGDKLAFATTKDGNSEIYTINKDGKGLKRLTFDKADDLSPTWSPKGNEIVFISDRGGTPQLYIMGSDGTNVRRLTFNGSYNTSPSWSPKGDWIAYTCRRGGRLKICLITPDGTKTILVTNSSFEDESASWSPNGRLIAFSSNRDGKKNIYLMKIDGSEIERITFNNSNNASPAWSPNL